MVDILHKIGIKSADAHEVYKALTTREGLSAWWTTDTTGQSKVGGVIQFRFDSSEIGQSLTEIVAYGTAVIVGAK